MVLRKTIWQLYGQFAQENIQTLNVLFWLASTPLHIVRKYALPNQIQCWICSNNANGRHPMDILYW